MSWIPAVALAFFAVAVLTVPGIVPSVPPSAGVGLLVRGPIKLAAITGGPSIGMHNANPFFAVVFHTAGEGPNSLRQLGAFYNSTPVQTFRFSGPGEGYDPTTSTEYLPPPVGTHYVATSVPASTWNFTWMKAWCNSRTPHCAWLGDLPGELNNTQAAVHEAQWFHRVMGFVPTYWQLDNEPEGWHHYGKNQTTWTTLDNSTPTALDYATMARNYIIAVHAKFPADQFIGIESSQPFTGTGYVAETAKYAGAGVAGMAYHYYPWVNGSSTNLSQFYGMLTAPTNMTWSVNTFRSALTQSCSSCGNIPVQIGEYQAGPAWSLSPFALTYAGAPFMAASIIQALRVNVSMFTPFESSSLINAGNDVINPEGLLYQRILANLTMGTDYATNVTAPGVGGVFSIGIRNGTHESILIVNTNTTYALRLPISTSVFPVGGTGSWWIWGPAVPAPVAHRSITLPSSYLIPQQGILLINNY